nr:MAG TPA: hypothetical protein [Caudoviricetes sp.]
MLVTSPALPYFFSKLTRQAIHLTQQMNILSRF